MGQKATRATLEEIASELNLISRGETPGEARKAGHWWERLLPGGEKEGDSEMVPEN